MQERVGILDNGRELAMAGGKPEESDVAVLRRGLSS
jgi:hypothetical protein